MSEGIASGRNLVIMWQEDLVNDQVPLSIHVKGDKAPLSGGTYKENGEWVYACKLPKNSDTGSQNIHFIFTHTIKRITEERILTIPPCGCNHYLRDVLQEARLSRSTQIIHYDQNLVEQEKAECLVHDQLSTDLIEGLKLGTDSDVIEVGCGQGSLACAIAQHTVPNGQVYAVDINHSQLDAAEKQASELALDNISWIQGNIYSLRKVVGYRTAELVHCRLTLSKLTKPIEALNQMIACVKPNGFLLIEEPANNDLICQPYTPLAMTVWKIINNFQNWLFGQNQSVATQVEAYLREQFDEVTVCQPEAVAETPEEKALYRYSAQHSISSLFRPFFLGFLGSWWINSLKAMESDKTLSIKKLGCRQILVHIPPRR